MNIALEFDNIPDDYTAKITRWVPYYKEMISAIAQNLPDGFSPRHILDLGCGNGNVAALLLKRFTDAEFILLDASEEILKESQKRFEGHLNLSFHHAYFQDIDYPKDSFDQITAGISLHHLKDSEKQFFFHNLFRWLRPGGCFSYSDLMIDKEDEPFHSQHLHLWEKTAKDNGTTNEEWDWIMEHYDLYDHPDGPDKQLLWLRQAGFPNPSVSWRVGGWTNVLAKK